MKKLASLTLSLLLFNGVAFADSPKDSPKDAPKEAAKPAAAATATKTNAEIAAQMEELRQALQSQQEQLQMLKEELAKRDREIEEAREAAAAANSRAADASTKATEAAATSAATSAEVKSTATALNTTVANMAASNAAVVNSADLATASGQNKDEDKGPATIRYKGISLTPGGFIEAATVNRQRGLSSDINTPFNSIPYGDNATGKLSEMNFSARQSRLSLLAETKIGSAKVSGYYEADFLGVGTTSNNRESNSYVFRQRQLWGRVDLDNGWAFSAGQMWSLATENRKGIVNRGEWFPSQIDPQYVVGYVWQRADALRATKSFGDKFTVAASMEGSQATIGGRGFSTYTAVNGTVTTNSFAFAPGAGAGLYNAFDPTGYSPNKLPDFIFKAAFDPGFGHYEIFGIVSDFRNRVYPCAVVSIPEGTTATATVTGADGTAYTGTYANNLLTGAGPLPNAAVCPNTTPTALAASNQSIVEGGGGFHMHAPVIHKKFDIGLTGVYGVGTGRFISAQLPDATIRPDGTLAPVHNAGWLGTIDWHVTPKVDIYAYVGGEYAGRAAYTGYTSVTGTAATIPVTLTSEGGASIIYPETQTTWKTSFTGAGGYGGPTANNVGCSVELPPAGNSAPSGGANCAGDTRYISEATLGFWHRIYQGEKGRLQWGLQYSYFYRNSWSGVAGSVSGQPHAVDNMVWTSFRYYIP
jgi:hypothetical protein